MILDVSPMKRVYHDPERGAVAVEAGATVGETFQALFERWGVVVPLGEYPGIGMGGHVAGGAFGFLCRQLGLAADSLYAVEVVTVDQDGRVGSVVATREESDPNRELWWTHTGGGAGNFGIVTRYWFRSPEASGAEDPAEEERNLAWVRSFYRELFAESGGVPVPGEAYDGAFINHPDTDLADPALNTSGVPWHTLYYKTGYPRLQRVKARWDPRNVFRHGLSVQA